MSALASSTTIIQINSWYAAELLSLLLHLLVLSSFLLDGTKVPSCSKWTTTHIEHTKYSISSQRERKESKNGFKKDLIFFSLFHIAFSKFFCSIYIIFVFFGRIKRVECHGNGKKIFTLANENVRNLKQSAIDEETVHSSHDSWWHSKFVYSSLKKGQMNKNLEHLTWLTKKYMLTRDTLIIIQK